VVAGFVIAALHAVIMRLPSIRRLRDTQMSAQ